MPIQLDKFKAFPKNPTISKVFREIGYADELGSGMRNTNKYTMLYSGGTPTFIEDNIFQIIIPINNVANLKVGPTAAEIITKNGAVTKCIPSRNPSMTRSFRAVAECIFFRNMVYAKKNESKGV